LRAEAAKLQEQIAVLESESGAPAPKRQKERRMRLGSLHDVDVDQARKLVYECRAMPWAGIDPMEARKTKAREAELAKFKDETFRQAGEEWYAENFKIWGPSAKRTSRDAWKGMSIPSSVIIQCSGFAPWIMRTHLASSRAF
jgi:hypothetical protein